MIIKSLSLSQTHTNTHTHTHTHIHTHTHSHAHARIHTSLVLNEIRQHKPWKHNKNILVYVSRIRTSITWMLTFCKKTKVIANDQGIDQNSQKVDVYTLYLYDKKKKKHTKKQYSLFLDSAISRSASRRLVRNDRDEISQHDRLNCNTCPHKPVWPLTITTKVTHTQNPFQRVFRCDVTAGMTSCP